MERRKAMRFRRTIASHAMPEARQTQGAPCGAPCPSLFRGVRLKAHLARGARAIPRGCLKIESRIKTVVMAGLVPAIPITKAPCSPNRDHRDKPGDDNCKWRATTAKHHALGSRALLTASASDIFAEPGFSGFCWLSCGAHPDNQTMSNVTRMRPSGSENRSA